MFKHVIYETSSLWAPCLAFAVTAGVFFFFALHAALLRKDRAASLSRLPLDD